MVGSPLLYQIVVKLMEINSKFLRTAILNFYEVIWLPLL